MAGQGPYALHERYASKPHNLLGLVIPNVYEHYDQFLGFVALSLGIVGVAATWRRWGTRALASVAVLSVFFAVGGSTALHGLLYTIVPLVEKARTPAAFSGLFSAAMATVAALGFDAILNRADARISSLTRRALTGTGVLLFLLGLSVYYGNNRQFPTDDRFLLCALIALLFGTLLLLRERDAIGVVGFTIAAVILLVTELSISALLPFPAKIDRDRPGAFTKRFEYFDVAQYLRELPGLQRVQVRREDIPIAFGDLYQIVAFDGYTASVPTSVWEMGMVNRKNLALYGANVFIGKEPLYEGQVLLREFSSGVRAWQLDGAYPRAWISHRSTAFPTVAAFRSRFEQGAFDSREVTPFVGTAPQLPACNADTAADSARIETYSMNEVTMRTNSTCEGLLILSDNAFPGWKATVDGQAAPILRPFHTLRGVIVPAGEHHVRMVYRPMSVILGAALSGLGFLLVSGIALVEWRRKQSNGHAGQEKPELLS